MLDHEVDTGQNGRTVTGCGRNGNEAIAASAALEPFARWMHPHR